MPGPPIDLHIYDSDEALLAGLRNGEADACTCLIKRFTPLVYARALQMTADPDEAETVLQQTFINACAKIDIFEGRSELGTWLYRIATNAALMKRRRRQRTPESLDTLGASEAEQAMLGLPNSSADPAGAALNAELRTQLANALAHLPETLREVFVLRELLGFSTEEAAGTLGIGVSAAKVRLHRARQRLRELLMAYLAGDGAQQGETHNTIAR